MKTDQNKENLTLLRLAPLQETGETQATIETRTDAPRGNNLRAFFEDNQGAYIEFSRAAYLLASVEGISFAQAAAWLIKSNAHISLRVFELKEDAKSGLPRFDLFEQTRPDDEFGFGPLSVLYAIRTVDDLWVDIVGILQRAANDRLRWERDEFWRFVIGNGVDVGANSFAFRQDCPTFLLDDWKASIDRLTGEGLEPEKHRMTAADWREAAKRAQKRVQDLEARNAQLLQAVKHLEEGSARRTKGAGKPIDAGTTNADSQDDRLQGKSRTMALNLIGGLAMVGAELDIHSPRLDGIGGVLDDLAAKGVKVSEQTLRDYLRDAAKIIGQQGPNS